MYVYVVLCRGLPARPANEWTDRMECLSRTELHKALSRAFQQGAESVHVTREEVNPDDCFITQESPK